MSRTIYKLVSVDLDALTISFWNFERSRSI
jgi:hypothetical protein